ncbi:hypothetical protein ACO2Q3_17105 [Caulobacter sp. KR2-114]|uniref:hypothetical protein n=1 Tax=Caulobacter sp. KR2-114 TaxID=3400912 RepID=UPI003C0ECD7E
MIWILSWIPLNVLILLSGSLPDLFMIWVALGIQAFILLMAVVNDISKIRKFGGGVSASCARSGVDQVAFLREYSLWADGFKRQ